MKFSEYKKNKNAAQVNFSAMTNKQITLKLIESRTPKQLALLGNTLSTLARNFASENELLSGMDKVVIPMPGGISLESEYELGGTDISQDGSKGSVDGNPNKKADVVKSGDILVSQQDKVVNLASSEEAIKLEDEAKAAVEAAANAAAEVVKEESIKEVAQDSVEEAVEDAVEVVTDKPEDDEEDENEDESTNLSDEYEDEMDSLDEPISVDESENYADFIKKRKKRKVNLSRDLLDDFTSANISTNLTNRSKKNQVSILQTLIGNRYVENVN
jgi:hypothetical protein